MVRDKKGRKGVGKIRIDTGGKRGGLIAYFGSFSTYNEQPLSISHTHRHTHTQCVNMCKGDAYFIVEDEHELYIYEFSIV